MWQTILSSLLSDIASPPDTGPVLCFKHTTTCSFLKLLYTKQVLKQVQSSVTVNFLRYCSNINLYIWLQVYREAAIFKQRILPALFFSAKKSNMHKVKAEKR